MRIQTIERRRNRSAKARRTRLVISPARRTTAVVEVVVVEDCLAYEAREHEPHEAERASDAVSGAIG